MLRSVEFLGRIISSEGVDVDTRKTQAVKNCPKPFTPNDIWSFYPRFDDYFVCIASPLTNLTQKSMKFKWLEACECSF